FNQGNFCVERWQVDRVAFEWGNLGYRHVSQLIDLDGTDTTKLLSRPKPHLRTRRERLCCCQARGQSVDL
ncbi:hypothetical protein FRB99_008987, partial [Tulasnella sp. 403]